ncbi:unnamed protein product [marine sediment metagenome]|uniref:Uncharacterized protein n=1 Tax=marine sediment metagenome TaxID=412755 RepID=X0ZLZ5_9ZZZZ
MSLTITSREINEAAVELENRGSFDKLAEHYRELSVEVATSGGKLDVEDGNPIISLVQDIRKNKKHHRPTKTVVDRKGQKVLAYI